MYGIKITEVSFSNTLDYYKGWVEKNNCKGHNAKEILNKNILH